MITIDEADAEHRLFELLARCEKGETFHITRGGKRIAVLQACAPDSDPTSTELADHVMTYSIIVTPRPRTILGPNALAKLAAAIGAAEATWKALTSGYEANVEMGRSESHHARNVTQQAGSELGSIDINIVPDGPDRRKRLLVADMESTIIEQEMLDELGDFIGARPKIEDITARAMRGELDFESALTERVGLLQGLPATVLDEVAKRITLMPGAEALIATMKANGAYCALVSGGFTVFTSRIAERLGFDEHRANVLEIENGKLTGRVKRPILGREAKLAALQELTAKLGLKPEHTLAVGDGANDLAMIGAAGLGVAFRAKPKVREAAAALPNGAVVTHGDLTALLALQGYAESETAIPADR